MKLFPVTAKKNAELHLRMEKLGLSENDIEERFIHGGGKGGQKLNKTASCVMLTHLPTGKVIRCQKERSRELNRFFARRLLCDELEGIAGGDGLSDAKRAEIEKIRKKKSRKRKRTQNKYGA